MNLSTVPMLDAEGNVAGGITIIDDITNEVTAKEEVLRNAYYDILTNIPNRTLFLDKLKDFLENKKENNVYGALLLLDIDHFKKVNETYGHDLGDQLLIQMVERIGESINSHDIFARITGNKFAILIPSLDSRSNTFKRSGIKLYQYHSR